MYGRRIEHRFNGLDLSNVKTSAELLKQKDKEIERLRGLIKQAFRDGTKICTNLDDHDFNIIWEDSKICQALKEKDSEAILRNSINKGGNDGG